MLSKGTGDALGLAVVVGICTMFAGWLLIPPAMGAAVVWLIGPRFGHDTQIVPAFVMLLTLWAAGNLVVWLVNKAPRWISKERVQ